MGKFYQGESISFVFRCRHSCGRPVDVTSFTVSAILRDVQGETLFRFSSAGVPGAKPVRLDRQYVFFRLLPEDTRLLAGSYVVELKVRKGDLVMIDITQKIKIYESVIGEDQTL